MMRDILVRVCQLREGAIVPSYATAGAACFDLVACEGSVAPVHPGQSVVVGTGLMFEVPSGHVMRIYSRSGHGFKNGVRLANCVGVIDSDYRGEVMVKLVNDGTKPFFISAGDRIAQALIEPIPHVTLIPCAMRDISKTERGSGGLGSTG